MFERDFIMRMIKEAAQVIASLMGMRKGGQISEAMELLQDTYRAYLGFDSQFLRQTEDEALLEVLLEKGFEEDMIEVLAGLLAEEGAIRREMGEWADASNCYRKAIYLLHYLNSAQPNTYSFQRMSTLDLLEDILAQLKNK